MLKVIVQTIVSETMNAAAAANPGRQRAASHSRIGNSRATGTIVCHGFGRPRECDRLRLRARTVRDRSPASAPGAINGGMALLSNHIVKSHVSDSMPVSGADQQVRPYFALLFDADAAVSPLNEL